MNINFEGKDYHLDLDEIDVQQARTIKRQTGLTLLQLQKGLEDVDVDSMVALYWLMMVQNGTTVDMNKVNFPVVKFGEAVINALMEEAKAAEENPTAESPETEQPTT